MAEVASAYVALIPSFRGGSPIISKELDGPAEQAGRQAGEKAGKGFGGTFLGGVKGLIGPLAGVLAGAGAVRFFGDSVKAASDLGESVNAVNVVFGDAADGVLALGKNAATTVGLSNTEFNGLAVRFSSFASTVAGEGGDVVGTLGDLTGRAADFASVMNLDVAQASQIFQSGLAGESEPLRQFGIDMSAAAVEAYAMETGIATAGQQMTEQQKVQARYGLLMRETAKTQGDFANTSDSLANRQRIAAAQFENVKTQVGEALLPAFQGLMSFVSGTALPGFTSLIGFVTGSLIPGIRSFAASVVEWRTPILAVVAVITAVFLPALIALGVQSTIAAAKAVAAWAVQSAAAVAGAVAQSAAVVRTVAGWVLMGTQSLIQAARMAAAWLIAMGPVGWVIAAVIGLAALVIANWDKIVAWTKSAWSAVTGWLAGAWENIKTTAARVWDGVLAFFRAIPGKIVAFFLNFTLPGLLIKHWASIREAAVGAWNALLDYIRGIPGRIVAGLGNLGRLLYDAGKQILQGLQNGIKDAVGGAVSAVKDAVGSVISGAKRLLGISSPSRVFAELGGFVAEGLAVGMERGASRVSAATRSLVDIPTAPRMNVGVVGAGPSVPGLASAGLPSQVTLVDADGSLLGHMRVLVDDQRRASQLAGRR